MAPREDVGSEDASQERGRMPIRLHDLRATFVTVSLANGKTEQWVSDRTGHRSSQMLALYTRQARQWSELELGALQPMDALLPEMTEAPPPPRPQPTDEEPGAARTTDLPMPLEPDVESVRDVMVGGFTFPLPGLPGTLRPPTPAGSEVVALCSDCWTRTSDPAVNSRLLYQLS